MQNRLVAKIAQTPMSMHDINLLPQNDIAEDWKERKDGGHGRLAVDDEERDVVDFEAIGEVAHTGAVLVGVGNDNYSVASVDEFLRWSEVWWILGWAASRTEESW